MMTGEWRASAPARLDFAGGWTDVAPFTERHGGVVVNAAIELRAHAGVRLREANWLVEASDLGQATELGSLDDDPGELPLHRAALRLASAAPCHLATRSEAPPGSGLGSSGALDVAMLAALDAASGTKRLPADLAEAAFQLEAVEAELPGGRQDQCAAALGGFHRLGFAGGPALAQPVPLDPGFADLLASRILLCYTGRSRVSSETIARVMNRYLAGDSEVTAALVLMVDIAERMADALRAADLARVAMLLSENWRQQQRLDDGMRTPEMARLEAAMWEAGAIGGKAAGAGAGGSMFFVLGGNRDVAEAAARAEGARVIPFRWAWEGVVVA